MPTRVRQAGCLGNVSITRPTNSLHMLTRDCYRRHPQSQTMKHSLEVDAPSIQVEVASGVQPIIRSLRLYITLERTPTNCWINSIHQL